MNPNQANSRESLQQAIDAEIKSLEESIKALEESIQAKIKSLGESIQVLQLRRNAIQPISSRNLRRHILLFVLTWNTITRWKAVPKSCTTPHIPHLSSMARDRTQSTPVVESHQLQRHQFGRRN
jgi:hypothetical protein